MKDFIKFFENHTMLISIWLIFLGIFIFLTIKKMFSKVININCYESILLFNKEKTLFLDIRDKNLFYKGHITNSINIDSNNIKSGNLKKLEKFKKNNIIIVCSNGFVSQNIAIKLINFKFKKIYVLKNGISEWKKENLPLIKYK